jgi:hypothetical protein
MINNNGATKEAQDDALSDGVSADCQIPTGRRTGRDTCCFLARLLLLPPRLAAAAASQYHVARLV